MPESPPDDKTIPDEERLYRRIFPDPDMIRPTENGGFRPSSGALKSSEPLSVDLGSLSSPEETRDRDRSRPFHVAVFTAGVARAAGCRVVRDRKDENPAHALVYGKHNSGSGGLTSSQAKKIAHKAQIVLLHPDAPLPGND